MLLAYIRYDDVDGENFICDNFYILDTDDFIIQSISYEKLKSLIKEERVDIFNVWYDGETDSLYSAEDTDTLLDISDTISSIDGTIKVGSNKLFDNFVEIGGKRVNIEFVVDEEHYDTSDIFLGYIFKVNGVDVAYFYPGDLYDNLYNIDYIYDNCFMGIDIVYKVSNNVVAVKFVIKLCSDTSNEAAILLLFSTDGDFIDSYEYDRSFLKESKPERSVA